MEERRTSGSHRVSKYLLMTKFWSESSWSKLDNYENEVVNRKSERERTKDSRDARMLVQSRSMG